jgi:GGDEF domain-containing protein
MEFSNDGIRDSLTDSIAPQIFLQSLGRESALADRENRKLSVLVVRAENRGVPEVRGFQDVLEYDLLLLNTIVKSQLRADEFYSRSIRDGFWILLRGDVAAAEIVASRIRRASESERIGFTPDSCLIFTPVERDERRGLADWVSRMDRASFPNE